MTRIIVSLLAFLAAFCVSAADARIATVDLERAFNGYYKTKIIDNEFLEQGKVYRDYIARQAELLRKDENTWRSAVDASLNLAIAPAERDKRKAEAEKLEKALKQRRAELEQYTEERAKALRASADEARKKVIAEIRAEVARRAAIEGVQIVLDASGLSTNDTALVLYASPAIDLTDKVLEELNRAAEADTAKSDKATVAVQDVSTDPQAKP